LNRSSERLIIVALIALIVFLLAVPSVGDAIRGIVGFFFGERGERYIGAITGIISLLVIVWSVWRWIFGIRGAETTLSTNPVPVDSTIQDGDDLRNNKARRVRDDARQAARQIRSFVQERDEDDPFAREEIPSDTASREYKDLSARYDEHMTETRRLYRANLLPRVVIVRDEFADLGLKDPELDRLHENPRNYNDLRTLADRLLAMADTVVR
jgi:hypothetical protein